MYMLMYMYNHKATSACWSASSTSPSGTRRDDAASLPFTL